MGARSLPCWPHRPLREPPTISSCRARQVELVAPPFVHPHEQATKAGPKIIEFKLTIEEKEVVIDEAGTKFQAMTFNGSMPGPMMVVHEGDYMELTLVNPDDQHHAAQHRPAFGDRRSRRRRADPRQSRRTGGAALEGDAPRRVRLSLRAGRHDPLARRVRHARHGDGAAARRPEGRAKASRCTTTGSIYIGENDLYVPKDENGKYKTYETLGESYADTTEVMRKLIPTHVVFNGRVGALTGKNAMTAKVGETVMIVHSQANRDTRPHLIGGHGDYVWETGKFTNPPEKDLETWFIRGGSAGAALYTFREPGIYAYVNHNLIEAVELGATAHIKVEGKWNDDLMKQVTPPGPIPPDKIGAIAPTVVTR